MARPGSAQPTEVELSILSVLWKHGPSTVREVHEALSEDRETGYSTTLKMMQVMLEKGLLKRNDSVRPQVYRAARSQSWTQRQLLDDLARKAFHGSAMRLVMGMVSSGRLTADELTEIQNLIDQEQTDGK
ncbi:MAG: BlaI/MecI/CopY family transcriptional regulator [Fuerstiella sp.]